MLDKLIGGASKAVTSNPLGTLLGAGGLGYDILQGQKQSKNLQALSQAAQQESQLGQAALQQGQTLAGQNAATGQALTAQGQALTQYLQNGTLPDAYMTQIDQAINDAKTAAISNAASQGQSTDPNQNTALATTLAKIEAGKPGLITQVAQQLFNSGSSLIGTGTGIGTSSAGSLLGAGAGAAGLSSSLYQSLVQNDQQTAAQTGKAIATLAQALNTGAGGKSGSGITLPGGSVLSISG